MDTQLYCIMHLPDVSEAILEMERHFPLSSESPVQDFGSHGVGEFFSTPALNHITVHPNILEKVREILGTDKIRLCQSVAWAKYGVPSDGKQSNRDQRMHMDYGNNMFGMPDDGPPQAVAAIVYYSDTLETGGGTAVVPRTGPDDPVYQWPYVHMPGISGLPFVNDRIIAEKMLSSVPESSEIRSQCYSREIVPTFRIGDVLMYRLNTWHRGTPVLPGKVRYTHNLLFKRADNTDIQIWNRGMAQSMYRGDLERFIGELKPQQLETLGFPPRDSDKWRSSKFCRGIRQRYSWAGFDMEKYCQLGPEPPPMPEFWHFSHWTIPGPCPNALRSDLFEKLRKENVDITLKNSNWKYCFQTIVGMHYLEADCYFFKCENDYMVDINLISGDRWTWYRLKNKITGVANGLRGAPIHNTLTPEFLLEKPESMCDEYVTLLGSDAPAILFERCLDSSDGGILHYALKELSERGCYVDHPCVEKWRFQKPSNFLECQMYRHAQNILKHDHRCIKSRM